MDNRFMQQIKKGVLDMIVLKLISQKDTYGYELIQQLEKQGNGFFDLKEGTLYPVLYRLEDSGMIKASWRTGEGRLAPKKYYHITEEGEKAVGEYIDIWKKYVKCVEHLCEEGKS